MNKKNENERKKNIAVSPAYHKRIKIHAARTGTTVQDFIEKMVEFYEEKSCL